MFSFIFKWLKRQRVLKLAQGKEKTYRLRQVEKIIHKVVTVNGDYLLLNGQLLPPNSTVLAHWNPVSKDLTLRLLSGKTTKLIKLQWSEIKSVVWKGAMGTKVSDLPGNLYAYLRAVELAGFDIIDPETFLGYITQSSKLIIDGITYPRNQLAYRVDGTSLMLSIYHGPWITFDLSNYYTIELDSRQVDTRYIQIATIEEKEKGAE